MTLNFHGVSARCVAALLVAVSLILTTALAQAQTTAGRRLALVVGNDTYPASPLVNARNDARSIAATLREIGFTVTLLEDATRNQMVARVAEMSEQLRPDDVAFFFYAGHGLQLDGENYLVPSDFEGTSVTAVRLTTLPVGEIQAALGRAKVSVLVLDACRNNPFTATRSGGRGLAAMEARGSIIAFATGAGQTAGDNPASGNGLFTEHLLSALREPNLPLREIFYRTRQRVYEASNGRQFPAVYDGLLGEIVLRDLVLKPGAGGTTATPTVTGGLPPAPSVPAPAAPAAAAPRPASPAPAAPFFTLPTTPAGPNLEEPARVSATSTGSDGSLRFELLHIRTVERVITTSLYLDAGVLTVSPGHVKWSESGETYYPNGPTNQRTLRDGDRDEFDATCADIEKLGKSRNSQKVPRWSDGIKVGGRNYNFWVIERAKGKLGYISPPGAVGDAIKAACPNVTVK